MLNVGGEYGIAGVLSLAWFGGSGGDTIGKYNTGGVFVRSATLNNWILHHATDAQVIPEPITMSIFVVAGVLMLSRRPSNRPNVTKRKQLSK